MFVQGVADLGKHDEENEETGDWWGGGMGACSYLVHGARDALEGERESRERERGKGEAGMSVGGGARRQHK